MAKKSNRAALVLVKTRLFIDPFYEQVRSWGGLVRIGIDGTNYWRFTASQQRVWFDLRGIRPHADLFSEVCHLRNPCCPGADHRHDAALCEVSEHSRDA